MKASTVVQSYPATSEVVQQSPCLKEGEADEASNRGADQAVRSTSNGNCAAGSDDTISEASGSLDGPSEEARATLRGGSVVQIILTTEHWALGDVTGAVRDRLLRSNVCGKDVAQARVAQLPRVHGG